MEKISQTAITKNQAFTGGLYSENMQINVSIYTFSGMLYFDIKCLFKTLHLLIKKLFVHA